MNEHPASFTFKVLEEYPPVLKQEGRQILEQLKKDAAADMTVSPAVLSGAEKILPLSSFLAAAVRKDPGMLAELSDSGELFYPKSRGKIALQAAQAVKGASDEEELMSVLRSFRNRQMFRIAWRDLSGLADLGETLADLTNLADICIDLTIDWHFRALAARFGTPLYPDGRPQNLIVLAMGKLGAGELNFSSDIDLIFAYPLLGQTSGSGKVISNEEFFTYLARKIIMTLSLNTADGIVFRVDTRLRPFGDSGPLVMCAEAVEEYYENYGRQWERYAMVKARAAAGDREAGLRLLEVLRPFVYRRYLDYSAIEALRQMKAMILAEQDREGAKNDIKLGPGGIRDVEFICQTFQLLKGGRIPALQERYLLKVLDNIEKFSLLDHKTCTSLRNAYVFLRIVENRLQEFSDQQVHSLPADMGRQLRLAVSTGFAGWDEFRSALAAHMKDVHDIFEGLFSERKQLGAPPPGDGKEISAAAGMIKSARFEHLEKECLLIWEAPEDSVSLNHLDALGFSKSASILKALKNSRKTKMLPGRTREILDELMPRLIAACAMTSEPDKALEGSLRIIEAVLKRSIYLMLLLEYPQALFHLVVLCSKSRWIADLISRQPILLDELIDAATLFSPLSIEELRGQLSAVMESISVRDLELFLDELRRFKKAGMLRVAACDLDDLVGVEEVGKMLTCLAQVLLERCFSSALAYLADREPVFYAGPVDADRCGMAVIAYGKMGGWEMGYASDLDLIFLYDPEAVALSRGSAPKTAYLFSRLVQRLIFLLTTRTSQGVLYQIDTRLRPNGSQGVLVSSIKGFAEYQKKKAWTWEHQAIIRARFAVGDKKTGQAFEQIRKDVLMTKRSGRELKEEILGMRQKIVKNMKREDRARFFDLKREPGGIVDIEFLVQFLVLLHAAEHEDLTAAAGCMELLRILRDLRLLSAGQADILTDSYRLYMKTVNHLTLDLKEAKVPAGSFERERRQVTEIFDRVLGSS